VSVHGALCPTCVVDAGTRLAFEYCSTPASDTSTGVRGLVAAFSSADVACGGLGSHTFAAGCVTFSTTVGSVDADQPVFLGALPGPGPCNRLVGAPAGSFVAEACLAASVFDTATGADTAQRDVDHFVVLNGDAAQTAWAANEAHVSNLQADYGHGGAGLC
jgi:hypothetical protein